MLTIHHLGVSQSDRVVWLMEELGLHYELKWYNRGEDFLAPAEFRALHPLGTAPIITDGDLVMAESTAIVEYISQRYGEGKLSVAIEDQDYPNYLYWMNFNNNFQSVLFMKMAYQAGGGDLVAGGQMVDVMLRREQGLYDYLEQRLGESEYLGAARFSCADIMAMFNLTSLEMLGARPVDESLPNTKAYVERICARPAYKKAMSIAGPAATPPA
ncbi:glutathione S-transferase [Halioglobus japonicus]|uniref:glutathione transferase n=1 Tax=Halioglobus japonicus TaxID=930805 RepID=A0AAP8MC32_9GAMM|nr:glutathione S-transferase [Halioglobus japonicus]AQA17150.1 glutathione S-transferase [Halioglobus japonicus]PLW85063.1 glutathione S-transferase [Halioglobus japonicus]GHD19270.1 glutathione S-transferase [Halioglobus japonicus]